MTDEQPRRPHILVVEDYPACQLFLRTLLEKRGYAVSVVEDGDDALTLLAGRPFDVVLMDVWLPTIDGCEVTRRLRFREEEVGRRTPVIGVTALAMPTDRERCLGAGMDVYLSKPYRAETLLDLVDAAVSLNEPAAGDPPPGENASAEPQG